MRLGVKRGFPYLSGARGYPLELKPNWQLRLLRKLLLTVNRLAENRGSEYESERRFFVGTNNAAFPAPGGNWIRVARLLRAARFCF